MSEIYEAVIVFGEPEVVHNALAALGSTIELRRILVVRNVSAIYRVAERDEPFKSGEMQSVATSLSIPLEAALLVFYDNRCGINAAFLFRNGLMVRQFGEDDELWVRLDEDGEPEMDGPHLTVDELEDAEEYERIRTPIDAGLTVLTGDVEVTAEAIKQAVCYGASS